MKTVEIKLTKEADKLICEIYASYLERRKSGLDKRQAKDFAIKDKWPSEFCKSWDSQDAKDSFSELKRAGFVKLYIGGGFMLESDAVVYMETRFQRGLSEVLERIAQIKSIIPFV